MDEETGEVNYRLHISTNAETGEEEYLTYCLDQETGEKQYYSIERICHSLHMPNPFKINTYTSQLSGIVRHDDPKRKSSEKRMEFITAVVFLIPTFIIFTPLLGALIITFDVILHRWCHWQNAKLGLRSGDAVYYQSPLHMIYKEFCSKCVAEEDGKKMYQIQNRRHNKRCAVTESLRRVVA